MAEEMHGNHEPHDGSWRETAVPGLHRAKRSQGRLSVCWRNDVLKRIQGHVLADVVLLRALAERTWHERDVFLSPFFMRT